MGGTRDEPWGGRAASRTGERARDAQARLAVLRAGARDGLWDWDVGGDVISFSERWKALVGCAPGELEDRAEEWFRRVHPRDLDGLKQALDAHRAGRTDVLENEFRMLHKDGSWRWMLCRAARVAGRELIGGSLTDITQTKSVENRALVEAFHDPLTGLPNRELFLDRLGLSLSRARRRADTPVAVLYLDLDRFHTVNDSLGVDAGDDLLVEVSDRLYRLMRLGDTLARLGGDKFGMLLDGVRGPNEAIAFAERVAAVLKTPLQLEGHQIFAQGSIGIALSRPPAGSKGRQRPEDLLRDAITAMHRAKEDGSTPHELFDPEMNARAKERLRLEADLHHAVERGEFVLHYQPIISFQTGQLSAFEALVRWQHPERGLVRPDHFVPIAEETGLIMPMGRWVLEQACHQMKAWRDEYSASADVAMAVNLSARQFEDPGLVAAIEACLKKTGLAPEALELEMTESVVMARTRENAATLQALRDLGIRILIDDFGTGYSSLASLQSFPLDSLKIDRSFVSQMEFEEGKAEIVRTILALARTLGLEAVAEGVETAQELEMLRDLECEHGQGYYFSNAIDGEAAAAWMESSPRW